MFGAMRILCWAAGHEWRYVTLRGAVCRCCLVCEKVEAVRRGGG